MTTSRPSGQPAEPADIIVETIARLDPTIDHAELTALITELVPQHARRRTLAHQLDARPDLLTGAGAHGSPTVITFIEALRARGIAGIVAPSCPFCHRTVRLTRRRDGLRSCKSCWAEAHAKPCTRCGRIGMNERRTVEGGSLCSACCRTEPSLLEQCGSCGRMDTPARRDGDLALCRTCCKPPVRTCSTCGKRKPCLYASTDTPRCKNCTDRQRTQQCSECGLDRPVYRRTQAGKPLCRECAKQDVCAGCQRIMPIRATTESGSLCQTCYKRDAASRSTCTRCGTTGHLHRLGLCAECAWPKVLTKLLSPPSGTMHPDVEPVFSALSGIDARTGLNWVARSPTQKVLSRLADATGPVSHELLDQLVPAGTAEHLRTILVDRAVLPARDELLIGLEQAVNERVARVENPAERKVLRNFATWHHLRRLRAIADRRPLTPDQVTYACNTLTAAAKLLAWLGERGQCLATCTQADIDEWLAIDAFSRSRGFVTWAVRRGHAPRGIDIPRFKNEPTREVLSEADQRWALARWLLADNTVDLTDRVAGLLVLLYAQRVAKITQLTTKHVTDTDDGVELHLGGQPITVPEAVGNLINQMIADRQDAVSGIHNRDWLFPGHRRGQPLSPRILQRRLADIEIPATLGRNTALMELAGDMPAAVISSLLGISVNRATRWNQDAGNTRLGYAAEVSRRE